MATTNDNTGTNEATDGTSIDLYEVANRQRLSVIDRDFDAQALVDGADAIVDGILETGDTYADALPNLQRLFKMLDTVLVDVVRMLDSEEMKLRALPEASATT
jgi:hypothetical protein